MDYRIRTLAIELRKGRAHGDKVITLLQALFRRNTIQKTRSDAKAILFPQATEPLPNGDDTFLGEKYRVSDLRDELLRGLSTTSGLSDFYVGQAKFHRSRKDPSNGFILFYLRDLKSNTESLLLLDQNNLRESFRDTDDSCPNDCYPSQVWLKPVEFLDSLAHPGRVYVHTGNKSKLEKMPESEWSIQSIQFDNPKTLEFAQLLALMKIVLSPFKGYLYRAAKQTLLWRLALMWQAMTDLNYMTAFSATQGMSLAGQISRQYAGLQVKSNFWRQVSYEVITLRADIINRQQNDPELRRKLQVELDAHEATTHAYNQRIEAQVQERHRIAQQKRELEERHAALIEQLRGLERERKGTGSESSYQDTLSSK